MYVYPPEVREGRCGSLVGPSPCFRFSRNASFLQDGVRVFGPAKHTDRRRSFLTAKLSCVSTPHVGKIKQRRVPYPCPLWDLGKRSRITGEEKALSADSVRTTGVRVVQSFVQDSHVIKVDRVDPLDETGSTNQENTEPRIPMV